MKFWGDLGHSETGSGETVGRVLKKKKKKIRVFYYTPRSFAKLPKSFTFIQLP